MRAVCHENPQHAYKVGLAFHGHRVLRSRPQSGKGKDLMNKSKIAAPQKCKADFGIRVDIALVIVVVRNRSQELLILVNSNP